MSQRRRMAWGGAPPKGGEAFKSRRWATGAKTRYFIVVGAMAKRKAPPRKADANDILAGICLSRVWTWTRTQDCLQGVPGWHLQSGLPAQQQVIPASDVPAAHAGSGQYIPSTNTAIRRWTKVFQDTTIFRRLQENPFNSSRGIERIDGTPAEGSNGMGGF
jgi:hypothetical protein